MAPAIARANHVHIHAVGAVLLAALCAWSAAVARWAGGDASGILGMLALLGGMYALTAFVTWHHPWLAAGLAALAAAAFAIWHWDTLLGRPIANPLGYSNAVGSLYLLAATAAAVVAARAVDRRIVGAAAGAVVAFGLVPWLNDTDTPALMTLVLLPLWILVVRRPATVRPAIVGSAVVTAAALASTMWLAATFDPHNRSGNLDGVVDQTLSERRPQLWSTALRHMVEHPVTGLGPGQFGRVAVSEMGDDDAAWAHHEYLQVGAETGIAGLVLGLALLAWCFLRLITGPGDPANAIAAMGIAAVASHASVDYVLHFAEVVAIAAVLLAAGSFAPLPPVGRKTQAC